MKCLLINSEFMGQGDVELGEVLMKAFLRNLCLCEEKPLAIVFYNSGVKLVSKLSTVGEEIRILNEAGVDLVACGTCLNHFNIQNSVENARIGNMQETVATLMKNGLEIVTI